MAQADKAGGVLTLNRRRRISPASTRSPWRHAAAGLMILVIAGCASGSNHVGRAQRARPLAPHSLVLGFSSDPALTSGDGATNSVWVKRAVAEGAGMVRVDIIWSQVAPTSPPPGFDAADPASPSYDWASTDAAVRLLSSHGLKILMGIESAPVWAEGPHKPVYELPGTWRPDAAQLAAFATAAARRYDGHYPDPLRPGTDLPRVRYWQPWNEPNLDRYLSPQWTRRSGHWIDTSPVIYRHLLNAVYAAVKHVSSSNYVVSAGTSPYGDLPGLTPPGHERMSPVRFYRDLFCIRHKPQSGSATLQALPCPHPPSLDAIDAHIYAIYGPRWHAINPDDVATPDIYKLKRLLAVADREGHVLPRGRKSLWVTEISWASRPPTPTGVPLQEHGRWYEQALYVLWRQGVDTVLFLDIRDPGPASPPQGGLYFHDGAPKPAATAFRFPFVSQRLGRTEVEVWGRAPRQGSLRIERLSGRTWTVIRTLPVRQYQVFSATVQLQGAALLRGQIGNAPSLMWRQQA